MEIFEKKKKPNETKIISTENGLYNWEMCDLVVYFSLQFPINRLRKCRTQSNHRPWIKLNKGSRKRFELKWLNMKIRKKFWSCSKNSSTRYVNFFWKNISESKVFISTMINDSKSKHYIHYCRNEDEIHSTYIVDCSVKMKIIVDITIPDWPIILSKSDSIHETLMTSFHVIFFWKSLLMLLLGIFGNFIYL